MHEWIYFIPVGVLWFILYWLIGGVIFAAIALFHIVKLRKAQFSCLFTLTSLLCALGATYTHAILGQQEIAGCLLQTEDILSNFAAVIGCAVFPLMTAGAIWFVALLVLGAILLYLSRSRNQSWVDGKLTEAPCEPVAATMHGEIR